MRSKQIEALVMKGTKRLYDNDKFRYQRFYRGIVACGARGCNLRCCVCWNWDRNECPSAGGQFYSPSEIAAKLEKLAGHKTDTARISGCEPILGRASSKHLAEIILNSKLFFILETNAVMIGAEPDLLDLFAEARNFTVRVSLKATNGLMWERFTGSDAFGFVYQQRGVRELRKRHIPHKIAFMPKFVDYKNIDCDNGYNLEEENLRYYKGTKTRLKERGLA